MVLYFLLAVLLAIPTLGLSIVAFLAVAFFKSYAINKARDHLVNEGRADDVFLSDERHAPSWANSKDEIIIFTKIVMKGALRNGAPDDFIEKMLHNTESFLELIHFAGAMEQQGASFSEQGVAVANKITQAWNKSLRNDKLNESSDRSDVYISAYSLANHKGMSDEDLETISKDTHIVKWLKDRAQKPLQYAKDQQAQGEVVAELLIEAWQRREKCILAYPILIWGLKHGLKEFEKFENITMHQEPFLMSDETISEVLSIRNICGEISQGQNKFYPTIRDIPEEVFLLPNLESFKLVGNGDKKYVGVTLHSGIPKAVGRAKKLTRLELPFCALKEIPAEIFTPWIEVLNLNMNYLKCIPDSIGLAKSLHNLQLEANDLLSISESIGTIDQLNVLCIGHNPNLKLPESITNLKSLTMFIHGDFKNLSIYQKSWVDGFRKEDRVRSDGEDIPF